MVRVLHVAESAKGGVGTHLSEVLDHQVAELGLAQVRALVPKSHAFHVSVDRRVVRTYSRGGRSAGALWRLAVALRREVRRFRPDIVHAHSSLAGLVVRLLYGWRPGRFAIIYCPHGWGFDRQSHSAKNRALRLTERALGPLTDRIVAVSEYEQVLGLGAGIADSRIALVRNGIADRAPPPAARWDESRIRCLFIGRLDRQKGLDTLLDAIEPLASKVCLRVIGAAVATREQRTRRAANVEYLGWRSASEIAAQIAAADVIVVPSRWEAFGLVAIEAMRDGKAVVASSIGGLREVVLDGVTGRLAPADSPHRLMAVLASGQREEWRQMGRAGRARYLANFTAERMNARLLALYDEVLQARAVPVAIPAAEAPLLAHG